MKKRVLLVLTLALCLLLVCGCKGGEQKRYDVLTNPNDLATQQSLIGNSNKIPELTPEPTVYPQPTAVPVTNQPANAGLSTKPTAAPTVRGQYAGATPVKLDPLDKPTPTPEPPLEFAYQVYDATKLRLSFEAPVGWLKNDAAADVFTLTNPDSRMDYASTLSVYARNVSSDYGANELNRVVKDMLSTIQGDFYSFHDTSTAERTLLDSKGRYADYHAYKKDGTHAYGRVHAVCVNRTLYILHMSCPYAYRETYKDTVYATFRKTVKITQ